MESLLKSAEQLAEIPAASARAYDRRKGLLTECVNRALESRDDLLGLIGSEKSLEMMEDNHRNHSRIVTTVLYLNGFRMLASILPWVYRAYKMHGFSYEYFPVELQAWKEAISKELEKEHAEAILPLYDWLLEQHERVIELSSVVVEKEGACQGHSCSSDCESFLNSLLKRDLMQAIEIGENRLKLDAKPDTFYQTTVEPALYEVGSRWESGKLTVADEHLATAIAQNVVANLQEKLSGNDKNRGRAIIAASVGELHDLGARIIAHCLELDGWDITYLGANMPLSDLTELAKKLKPDFVGVSVAMPYHLHYVKQLIDSFKATPELLNTRILIGGQVFNMFPEAKGCFPEVPIISKIEEAVTFVRGWGVA